MRWLMVCAVALVATASAMELPKSFQISPARIASAQEVSDKSGGRALIVMQAGRVLHEAYSNGGSATERAWLMSITKSIVAIATLTAASDGILALDQPVFETISEWKDNPQRKPIVIRQLLDQTSGIMPGNSRIYANGAIDKNARALKLQIVSSPGSEFDYGPAGFEVLEEVFRRSLADRGIRPIDYIRTRLFAPLGIRGEPWRTDSKGNAYFSTGAKLSARELAKFGEFVRTRGRIGFLPIVAEDAFNGIGRGTRANPIYGLAFWLNNGAKSAQASEFSVEGTLGEIRSAASWASLCLAKQAPPDLVAMIGSGGMRCYIVPSKKLVIVRFGQDARFSDADFLNALF